jgi:hypothetical protein
MDGREPNEVQAVLVTAATVQNLAGISSRRLNALCRNGHVAGAWKARGWCCYLPPLLEALRAASRFCVSSGKLEPTSEDAYDRAARRIR